MLRSSQIYTLCYVHHYATFIEMWYRREYYSAIKKDDILPLVTPWMDLEDFMLSEIRWRKTNIYEFTYMWNTKINKLMNKSNQTK